MKPIDRRWRKYAILPLLIVALGAGVLLWKRGQTVTVAELLDRFPAGDAVVAWIDVAALRSSGVLDLIAGYKPVDDPEYAAFIEQSGFDYQKDLDGVLLTVQGDDVYMLLTGRLPSSKFESYVKSRGGSCSGGLCRVTGSQPNRKVSFSQLQPGLMALAVSPAEDAVAAILNQKRQSRSVPSEQPVWVSLPPAALRRAPTAISGTRAFASALAKAETVTLSLAPRAGAFEVVLDVKCPTAGDAAFLHLQLEEATELLKSLIAREKKAPNPNDLSGVLTAGTFGRNDRQVWGKWPIQKSFVQSLAGGAL